MKSSNPAEKFEIIFSGQSGNFVENSENTNCTKLLHCYYFPMNTFAMNRTWDILMVKVNKIL